MMDKVVREHLEKVTKPKDISEAAKILQTAQECYLQTTEKEGKKERKESTWRENVERKIQKLTAVIELMKKKEEEKKLSEVEVKESQKVLRSRGGVLDKLRNVSKVKTDSEEKKRVYEDKIRKYESRKEYRK